MDKGTVCLAYCAPTDTLVVAVGPRLFPLAGTSLEIIDAPALKHANTIATAAFNNTGGLLVTGGEDKTFKVWNTADWALVYDRACAKKVTAATFDSESKKVLYSEKNGDMFACAIGTAADAEGDYLLGHFSVITDSVLPVDKKYIISADRDEKIRVTKYPSTDEIQTFCFGHLDSVTRLAVCDMAAHTLLSGGMDGTLRLWNYLTGTLLDSQFVDDTDNTEAEDYQPPGVLGLACSPDSKVVAVIMTESPGLFLFRFEGSKLVRMGAVAATEEDPCIAVSFCKDENRMVVYRSVSGLHLFVKSGSGYTEQAAPALAGTNAAIAAGVADMGDLKSWHNPFEFLRTHRKVKSKGSHVPAMVAAPLPGPAKKKAKKVAEDDE